MSFLKNAWYCAGFPHELGTQPILRTFLDEPVLLMRAADGRAVAMSDRCPHRFAPLHKGKCDGERIQCLYHGLQFDMNGRCVHNPHGDKKIPAAARVRTYPLVERHLITWIWMGDAPPDESSIPDFSRLTDTDGMAVVHGYLQVACDYRILLDNLTDISHAEYLHPFLSQQGANNSLRAWVEQPDPATVWSMSLQPAFPTVPLYQLLWGDDVQAVSDMRAHMRWTPPSNLFLDTGVVPCGSDDPGAGPAMRMGHLLVPETETSSHYFWISARDRRTDDTGLNEMLAKGLNDAFLNEDAVMLQDCQRYMGRADVMALKPILLSCDAASVRLRRVLAGLIEAEHAALAPKRTIKVVEQGS